MGVRNSFQPNRADATLLSDSENRQAINPVASDFDLPSFPDEYLQTLLPANTPVTAVFAIDTTRLPSPVVTNGGSDSATLGPSSLSHIESGVEPWITARVEVGGFTFGSLLSDRDANPGSAFPTPPFFTNTFAEPGYDQLLSYGQSDSGTPLEGFRTRVVSQSDYRTSTPQGAEQTFFISTHDFRFDLWLLRFVFGGDSSFPGSQSFLGDPFALPTSFEWDDDDINFGSQRFGVDQGILNLQWSSVVLLDHFERQEDESILWTRDYSFLQLIMGVQVTSARAYTVDPAAVPEPSTMALGGIMLMVLWLGRKRLVIKELG